MIKTIDSFMTGSRAYGIPREDSDLDVAVLMEDSTEIWKHTETPNHTCRFGKLNLITFTNKDNFEAWRDVTNKLIALSPVHRDDAVKAFQDRGFGQYGEKKADSPLEE